MKKPIVLCAFVLTMMTGIVYAQTQGTFTLSLNTASTGGYSPKHLIAIWLENSNASFVKTKLMQSSGSNLDHLGLWTSRTGSNTVDATTGATLTTHGNITVVWNGTDVSGAVVPDGIYNVWVEMAWASSLSTGKTYSIFPFTKGPSAFQSTPANLTNFTNITLNWTPSTPTTVEKVSANTEATVFPNPASGVIHIRFKNGHNSALILINDASGKQVYKEHLTELSAGEKTIDISGLRAGVYFVRIHFENREETIRIVKIK